MKKIKIVIIFITMLTLIMLSYIPVYAVDLGGKQNEVSTNVNGSTDDTSWLTQAFQDASSFLEEDLTETDLHLGGENEGDPGVFEKILSIFKTFVKAINTILLVLLAGISTISLAITGIRYILPDDPMKKTVAKNNLHTALKGMFFGFGAYLIWRIAMTIIQLIIELLK